jgi:hypothetical protein
VEHREGDVIGGGGELEDLGVGAGFLPGELVAREPENAETLRLVVLMERTQTCVLRGEASSAGDVDDEQYLVTEIPEFDIVTDDRLHGQVVEMRHGIDRIALVERGYRQAVSPVRRGNLAVVVLLAAAFVVGGFVAISLGRGDVESGLTASTTVAVDISGSAPDSTSPDSAADSTGAGTSSSAETTDATTSTVETVPSTPAPEVDAQAYVVFDATNGVRLASKNADEQRAVGSLIKLLTAYVVMQAGEPDREVDVPSLTMDPQESQIGLIAGERYSRALLLRAMLIVSANDAARTLAIDVGGSEDGFVDMMNAAADDLGLQNTEAKNPVGLDADGAFSTADDILSLAQVLMKDETFRVTVARQSAQLHGVTFGATNDLLTTYEGADGIKTGRTTNAQFCLAGSATRDGRTVLVVVLGSSSDAARLAASTTLLDWAFSLT